MLNILIMLIASMLLGAGAPQGAAGYQPGGAGLRERADALPWHEIAGTANGLAVAGQTLAGQGLAGQAAAAAGTEGAGAAAAEAAAGTAGADAADAPGASPTGPSASGTGASGTGAAAQPGGGFVEVFKAEIVPDSVRDRIAGVSWKEGCPVPIEDLRYITVSYVDFGQTPRYGELIMHKSVAGEIVDIFKEIYDARFPIARMELVDGFGADDALSMEANNTSAFNYRTVSGTASLSKHAYGLAIDINAVQNPYVVKADGYVSPAAGREYADRAAARPGMILPGDPVHAAFKSRGWTWGGDWKYTIDYQHFQKDMPEP